MSRRKIYDSQAVQKRAWRARQGKPIQGDVIPGSWLPVTGANARVAIIDAVGKLLRDGDPDGHAAAVLAVACGCFGCPEIAALAVGKKLRRRQPKILRSDRSPGDVTTL